MQLRHFLRQHNDSLRIVRLTLTKLSRKPTADRGSSPARSVPTRNAPEGDTAHATRAANPAIREVYSLTHEFRYPPHVHAIALQAAGDSQVMGVVEEGLQTQGLLRLSNDALTTAAVPFAALQARQEVPGLHQQAARTRWHTRWTRLLLL